VKRVLALAVALLLMPTAEAQTRPVIGVLGIGSPEVARPFMGVLVDGLRKLGHRDGETVIIEARWAQGDVAKYPQLARELIERRAAVIIAPCGPSLRAIREISRTVPVVSNCADEANFLGEVASLSRPGGYTTGTTFLSPESVGKRLQLLKEAVPGLTRLAVLHQPKDPIDAHWRELERLRREFGLVLQSIPFEHSEELGPAFEVAVRGGAQAVFVFPTNRILFERARIAELALKHRLATMFEFAVHVDVGGLVSYGGAISEWAGRTTPAYVDRILKGAKAGDLPVVQPSQFELVVNLRTAKALGLKLPQALLLRADRVIE
jgi:putative ABC transport system substrate-binding protein